MLKSTYAEARKAKALHNKHVIDGWEKTVIELGDGWAFIGSGHSRHAYLSPSRIVYKVGNVNDCHGEHMAALLCRSVRTKHIAVPETKWYDTLGVVAMEYIEGVPGLPQKNKRVYEAEIKQVYGEMDWWYLNFIFDGEKVWCIDLGQFSYEEEMDSLKWRIKQYTG